MPRLSAAAVVLVALAFAAGCQTASDVLPPPTSTTELVLRPDGRAVASTLWINTALKIVLPAPAQGPAYAWTVLGNNTHVLKQTSEIAPVPGSAEGRFAAVFQARYPGRSVVRFAALQPGQAESQPKDLYQVAVVVKAE